MAKFCPLFSGSSGNSAYFGTADGGILVDAGVSAARIKKALEQREIPLEKIKAVFITHEHTDHIAGVRVLCAKSRIPVYSTKATYEAAKRIIPKIETVDWRIIDGATELDNIKVTNFPTMHDCEGSCGYIIDTGEHKAAVCTDLGAVTDTVHNALEGCDLVMLESNHDVMMLQNNMAYPYPLKRRILGENGHLSNSACASELERLVKSGTTRFVLAHLSRENNMPTLAKQTSASQLYLSGAKEDEDYYLSVAAPEGNGFIIM